MRWYLIFGLFVVSILVISCVSETVEPVVNQIEVEEPVSEESVQPEVEELKPVVIDLFSTVPMPDEVTIKAGQEVIWRNRDRIPYQILGDKLDLFKSPKILPGDVWSRVYEVPGEYVFIVSPGKPGKVIVE
ncbi:MAG: hypothetical protein U9R08_06065 [Nanoarchaeota archaeon]|nr:hypothetical protein [Nanoarchaeota archaeon]